MGIAAETFRGRATSGLECPSCARGEGIATLYKLKGIPVHSAVLVPDADTARRFPVGNLTLCWCPGCGLVFNAEFDPAMVKYGSGYEDAQGNSQTFTAFARDLARTWIGRYGLSGARVVEIGCGQGDFLRLFCAESGCQGIGFDPAYIPGHSPDRPGVAFRAERFTETHAPVEADFIICRHTLEHIGAVGEFLRLMRRACGESRTVRLGFEVPDLRRILVEGAFWDVYYEHASYFTAGSLARAFEAAGFEVLDVRRVYGNQYLVLDAAPAAGTGAPLPPIADDLEETAGLVEGFRREATGRIAGWRTRFASWRAAGRRIALWGSGSKAVGFLTTIGDLSIADCVVDINPARHGRFMPGCPMPIVAPATLADLRPDIVIAMNPIYRDEIAADLASRGLTPQLHTADERMSPEMQT